MLSKKLAGHLLLTSLLLVPVVSLAEQYEHGHQALQLFDEQGIANSPAWVRNWILFMGLSFIAGVFFIKEHVIARWVLGGFVLGIIFSMGIAPLLGIPPLSGFIALCHIIFWGPALYHLLSQRPFLQEISAFSIWSGVMMAVILFSFIFDIRDAVIYLHHILT